MVTVMNLRIGSVDRIKVIKIDPLKMPSWQASDFIRGDFFSSVCLASDG
jgi:hypothetical protein